MKKHLLVLAACSFACQQSDDKRDKKDTADIANVLVSKKAENETVMNFLNGFEDVDSQTEVNQATTNYDSLVQCLEKSSSQISLVNECSTSFDNELDINLTVFTETLRNEGSILIQDLWDQHSAIDESKIEDRQKIIAASIDALSQENLNCYDEISKQLEKRLSETKFCWNYVKRRHISIEADIASIDISLPL